MKTVGLIAEYNPFHNGHLYHMEKARELAGADHVIVVMSGDFIQRGAPAMYDKYLRTSMALDAGADLVLELPAAFAASSAQDFAACGIALLDRLGVTDSVCFGSECGSINLLNPIATILNREPGEYTNVLKESLKNGASYPDARNQALLSCVDGKKEETIREIMTSPNNILGIEYLRALDARKSSMQSLTIKRAGAGYHDSSLEQAFSSASAIRKAIAENSPAVITDQVPSFVTPYLTNAKPLSAHSLTPLLNYTLLKKIECQEALCDYADISDELDYRLRKCALEFGTFEERIMQLKTRQYTYTRISRALLHLVLEIKTADIEEYKAADYVSYARVLGLKKDSASIMKQIKANSDLPLVTKPVDSFKQLSPTGIKQLKQDIFCSHVYQSLLYQQYQISGKNEYTRPVVIQ